jgi:holin-like protein
MSSCNKSLMKNFLYARLAAICSREPRNYPHGTQWPHFRFLLEFDMLAALAALLTFQCLGEGVSYVFHLPVPGPVIGMLLLFGFVMMRPQTADAIEPTALELLRHLSLLFVPAGVGIMVSASRIRGDAIAVIVSIAVSTTLAIAVAALVTRALMRRQLHNDADHEAAQ